MSWIRGPIEEGCRLPGMPFLQQGIYPPSAEGEGNAGDEIMRLA